MANQENKDFKSLLTDPFANSVNKSFNNAMTKCLFVKKPDGKERLKKHHKPKPFNMKP